MHAFRLPSWQQAWSLWQVVRPRITAPFFVAARESNFGPVVKGIRTRRPQTCRPARIPKKSVNGWRTSWLQHRYPERIRLSGIDWPEKGPAYDTRRLYAE